MVVFDKYAFYEVFIMKKAALKALLCCVLASSLNIFSMNIFQAIEKNNEFRVREILDSEKNRWAQFLRSSSVSQKNEYGLSPLHLALQGRRNKKIINLLLENGANISDTNNDGYNAFHLAVLHNKKEIVELFIEKGANIDSRAKKTYETPIGLAIKENNKEMFKFLLQKGAAVGKQSPTGWGLRIPFIGNNVRDFNMLHTAVFYNRKRMVELLLKKKSVDVNSRCKISKKESWPALYFAIAKKNLAIAKLLVKKGANVKEEFGLSPLWLAQNKYIENLSKKRNEGDKKTDKQFFLGIIKLLIENGVDFNRKSVIDSNLLHWVLSVEGGGEVAKLLIEKGANLNTQNDLGCTPLHFALARGWLEIVNLLVEKGADINIKDRIGFGYSPLMLAIATSSKELIYERDKEVARIVNKSASDSITVIEEVKDRENNNVFNYLQYNIPVFSGREFDNEFSKSAVMLLLEHGSDFNEKDKNGSTVFHWAAGKGYKEIILFLLGKDADVNVKNNSGNTPLYFAVLKGKREIVELLIENGATENLCTLIKVARKENHQGIVTIISTIQTELGTLLNAATNRNDVATVKSLVERGANLNIKNNTDKTALHEAIDRDYLDTAEYLIQNGASVRETDNNLRTPLHSILYFAMACDITRYPDTRRIIEILIEKGSNIYSRDINERTTLALGEHIDNSYIEEGFRLSPSFKDFMLRHYRNYGKTQLGKMIQSMENRIKPLQFEKPIIEDKCYICLEKFDFVEERENIVLHPCGHNFCRKCVEGVFSRSNQYKCSHCRTETEGLEYRANVLTLGERKFNVMDNNIDERDHALQFDGLEISDRCSICSKEFDDNERENMVLHPCGDNFCRKCIKDIFVKTDGPHKCPSCNREIGNLEYRDRLPLDE